MWKVTVEPLTEDILKLFEISIPIKDIHSVVKQLGGNLFYHKTNSYNPENIIRKEDNSFEIYISPKYNKIRETFTIAREIGHLFLHMGYQTNDALWADQNKNPYYKYNSLEKEKQANEFAYSLLMPKRQFKIIMDKFTSGSKVDTSKIAEYFHVSLDAASDRGKSLGYFRL